MYHIIIQTERRTQPERMAIPIAKMEPTGTTVETPMGEQPEYVSGPTQLHHMGALPENIDNEQFVMVAEWDGTSPYVIQHKGNYSARTMGYAGWPEITKEQYEAEISSTTS